MNPTRAGDLEIRQISGGPWWIKNLVGARIGAVYSFPLGSTAKNSTHEIWFLITNSNGTTGYGTWPDPTTNGTALIFERMKVPGTNTDFPTQDENEEDGANNPPFPEGAGIMFYKRKHSIDNG